MNEKDIQNDFARLSEMKPPVKRAAYSDRTAWLMAILSEIAYLRFDEENQESLLALAGELANLTDQNSIAEKLESFAKTLEKRDNTDNRILRSILNTGGFELNGILFDRHTDTQGYVAVRRSGGGMDMAVVCFRGTQQKRDWMTNLDIRKTPIRSKSQNSHRVLGNVHQGFNAAFKSVEGQIEEYLRGAEDLPLYITGHSLGGALATLATWHMSGDRLAACYTYGAPRVGDNGLLDRFRTPVYRIVNGADPVPLVPPSEKTIGLLKVIARALGTLIPILEHASGWLIKRQGFRHYGFQRYLSICPEGSDGTYPKLRNEFGISNLERSWRYARLCLAGEATSRKRIDKYHDIALYRTKLRAYAIRRQRRD